MVRLTDRPDMTLDVYRGWKTIIQQQQHTAFGKLTNTASCTRCEIPVVTQKMVALTSLYTDFFLQIISINFISYNNRLFIYLSVRLKIRCTSKCMSLKLSPDSTTFSRKCSALLLIRVSYCCTHLIHLRERIENVIATEVS